MAFKKNDIVIDQADGRVLVVAGGKKGSCWPYFDLRDHTMRGSMGSVAAKRDWIKTGIYTRPDICPTCGSRTVCPGNPK